MKSPAVYLLASKRNGTLYIGVTSDLIKRVWQHREGLAEGFTNKYDVKLLVWYEQHESMESAIGKEKAMKKWLRKWKLATIEKTNPDWRDLWPEITGETASPVAPSPIPPVSPSIISTFNPVIPANAGIQQSVDISLDSRIRGNDGIAEDVP